MENMLFGNGEDKSLPDNLIRYVFSDEMIRALMYHCLRVDIADNNDKADMIKMMLPKDFVELGTGTNRIAFLYNGMVYKIALDRRGLTDNFTEFKRSAELPMYLARTYETNLLINVCEYVTIIDQAEFRDNEDSIKDILRDIAKAYLFDDIGFSLKNYCNWGSRWKANGDSELVILDYGYLYPLMGQNMTQLFTCPKCGSKLKWNANFTSFVCQNTNGRCQVTLSPTTIRHNMKLNFESAENKLMAQFNSMEMPNLDTVEQAIREINVEE